MTVTRQILLCCLVTVCLTGRIRRSEDELYRSHLYSSYLHHRLPSPNSVTSYPGHHGRSSNKREVKLSKSGVFYHEGPYVSHKQTERKADPIEIQSYSNSQDDVPSPNLNLVAQPNVSPTPTTTPNPYTYSVTSMSVTPSISYRSPITPGSYFNSPTPKFYIAPPTAPPSHKFSKFTPVPQHSTPKPSLPVSSTVYPLPPIPTYPSTSTSTTPAPSYQSTMTPSYQPTASPSHVSSISPPVPFSLIEEHLPPVHHPPRNAQFSVSSLPIQPHPEHSLPSPTQPAQSVLLSHVPPTHSDLIKPALTFQDSSESPRSPLDFTPLFDQEPRQPKQLDPLPQSISPSDQRLQPQPIFGFEFKPQQQFDAGSQSQTQSQFQFQPQTNVQLQSQTQTQSQQQPVNSDQFPALKAFHQFNVPQPTSPLDQFSPQPTVSSQQFSPQPAIPQQFSPQPTDSSQQIVQQTTPRPQPFFQFTPMPATPTPPPTSPPSTKLHRFMPRPSSDLRAHSRQQQLQSQPQQFQSQPQQFQSQPQQLQSQPQQFQLQPQQNQFPSQAEQFSFDPDHFLSQQQQPQPQQQVVQAQQQNFQSQNPQQFQVQQQQPQQFQTQQQFQEFNMEPQHQFEPQTNIDQTESLLNSITKAAVDREPRRQLTDLSKMKHMTRTDALARLMDIAGSDWDLSVSIQENLVNGGSEVSDYSCPTSEGHFPDTEKCNVYYQCANGIATKQSCGAGLKYNVLTNQCDWETSVDCSLNRDPRMLTQHAGPSPRPQVAPNFQPPFTAQTAAPFSNFFRV